MCKYYLRVDSADEPLTTSATRTCDCRNSCGSLNDGHQELCGFWEPEHRHRLVFLRLRISYGNLREKFTALKQRVHPARVSDLTNRAVQSCIQAYLDEKGCYPRAGDPNEYAEFFEAAYHSASDRATFLNQFLIGKNPSYGHHVLAQLMKADKTRVIWTTNFDKLIEDAAASGFLGNISRLVVADLGEPAKAESALSAEQWPLMVKLHGDFHSERLKNTSAELQSQDAKMRDAMCVACRRYGLAVSGYSGRDSSIIEVLEETIKSGKGYFPLQACSGSNVEGHRHFPVYPI